MKQLIEHIYEALKINSKSKVNKYNKLTDRMISQLNQYGNEEYSDMISNTPFIDPDFTRDDFEKLVKKILGYHSSGLESELYDRLHDYIDHHTEDKELEDVLTEIMNNYL